MGKFDVDGGRIAVEADVQVVGASQYIWISFSNPEPGSLAHGVAQDIGDGNVTEAFVLSVGSSAALTMASSSSGPDNVILSR